MERKVTILGIVLSQKRYLLPLRTIPSVVTFLSTIIALHTFYIDPSIAFDLLLLGNPNLGPTIMMGAKTLLGLLASVILVAFGHISLGNKSHMRSASHF